MSISVWPKGQPAEERLARLVRDAEALLGVCITVKDQLGMLRAPDGSPLFQSHVIHESPYCQRERANRARYRKLCRRDCNTAVPVRAREERAPFSVCCYRGAVEVVVPVFDAGQLCFVLHAGVFRDPAGGGRPEPPAFSAAIREAYRHLPVLEEERGQRLARVLDALGKAILQEAMELRRSEGELDGRVRELRRLIDARAHEKLTLAEVASTLGVSPSRASHLVRELTGDSLQNLLLKERVARAQSLLRSSEMSLKQIAAACGFSNEYYFSRQFRQICGMPPGRYAAQNKTRPRASGTGGGDNGLGRVWEPQR